jgi:hypothetical protein
MQIVILVILLSALALALPGKRKAGEVTPSTSKLHTSSTSSGLKTSFPRRFEVGSAVPVTSILKDSKVRMRIDDFMENWYDHGKKQRTISFDIPETSPPVSIMKNPVTGRKDENEDFMDRWAKKRVRFDVPSPKGETKQDFMRIWDSVDLVRSRDGNVGTAARILSDLDRDVASE